MAHFPDKRSTDHPVWRFNSQRHIFWPHISINLGVPNCSLLLVASTTLPRCWPRQLILLCSKSLTRQRSQQYLSQKRKVRRRLDFSPLLLGLPRSHGSSNVYPDTWILSVLGFSISPLGEIAIACLFAVATGAIAYRGIQGSTKTNVLLNVVQIGMLVVITGMALAYRFINPQHVSFTFTSLGGIVTPHDIGTVLFQATIAILVLVGFESATAYTAEAKDPKVVPKAIILSLIIQGAFAYLFEYFGAEAWMNNSYTITSGGKTFTGFSAAAVSSAPIGDMVHNLGNVFLGGNGFTLEINNSCNCGRCNIRHNPRVHEHLC